MSFNDHGLNISSLWPLPQSSAFGVSGYGENPDTSHTFGGWSGSEDSYLSQGQIQGGWLSQGNMNGCKSHTKKQRKSKKQQKQYVPGYNHQSMFQTHAPLGLEDKSAGSGADFFSGFGHGSQSSCLNQHQQQHQQHEYDGPAPMDIDNGDEGLNTGASWSPFSPEAPSWSFAGGSNAGGERKYPQKNHKCFLCDNDNYNWSDHATVQGGSGLLIFCSQNCASRYRNQSMLFKSKATGGRSGGSIGERSAGSSSPWGVQGGSGSTLLFS